MFFGNDPHNVIEASAAMLFILIHSIQLQTEFVVYHDINRINILKFAHWFQYITTNDCVLT